MLLVQGNGFGDFADGDDFFGAVLEGGDEGAGGAEDVEDHADGQVEVLPGEGGQFSRREDGFYLHRARLAIAGHEETVKAAAVGVISQKT